jgi:hypothetical protein
VHLTVFSTVLDSFPGQGGVKGRYQYGAHTLTKRKMNECLI